ncbi:unnamed protein product [Arabis nemorensis]|uniref:MATH domain-containing protein n=1 Tax=Arabis nemorensis TaxID=586526 RepID=A0A565BXS8_9BRAS|nr:unnamed protein product [Arabis nemorensis]
MGNDEAFTWVIKNFSSLQSEKIYSDPFVIGGCRWRLLAYPKGFKKDNNLSLYMVVVDYKSLPSGWRRHAKVSFTIVNQRPGENSELKETSHWYHDKVLAWGFHEMLPLTELKAKDSGFLVNGHLKIVAPVNVLEVIGKLDVSEESEEATQPLKKIKLEDDSAVSSDLLNKTQKLNEINGYTLLPSQINFLKRLFVNHRDVASELLKKNPHVRTGYMNVLLSLTHKLCRSPQELSNDDLTDVRAASLQEMEKELKTLKQKCLDLETQMDKKKSEIL